MQTFTNAANSKNHFEGLGAVPATPGASQPTTSNPAKQERKPALFMRWVLTLLLFVSIGTTAQVSVTATAGTVGPTAYTTLKLAFDAINAGTHQGDIVIGISASTTEGATPATLNSSGAGTALYTSVLIQPTSDGVSVSGNPAAGFGVIQLNGADNVTIDGDNAGTGGINRNLTVTNTATATTSANSVIRIATSAAVTSANNITIRNCILNDNVTGGNSSLITSTTGASNLSFGIYAGGNGGATATGAPTALTSVTTNTAPSGTTINSLLIDNNAVNQCARGIVFNGAAATQSTGVTITNNTLGTSGALGSYPFTTPASTVYTKGIWINGTTAITITGNTLNNILSYVGTTMTGIELAGAIGAGTINISSNNITAVTNNGTSSSSMGVLITTVGGPFSISANTIANIQGNASSNDVGINIASSGGIGTVSGNKISGVYNRTSAGWPAYGINLGTASNGTIIQNNFIYDLNAFYSNGVTSTSFGIFGIIIQSGTGHKIYHNSVNLASTPLTGSGTGPSACLLIPSTSRTGLDVRNNIFANTMPVTGSSINSAITLPSGSGSALGLTLNNNAYYTGTGDFLAQIITSGTTYATANFNPAATTPSTNWRSYSSTLSATGTNDNASYGSIAAAPFISATNLHLDPASGEVANVEQKGATGTGVTTDIDADTRPNGVTTNPDMGADEIALAICSGAVGGTISPSTVSRCAGLTYTMSSTGATTGAGITYQWEVSATGGGVGFGNVSGGSGAASTSYTTGALTAGTFFYRLRVTCSAGPVIGYSNELTVTVNALPVVGVSPSTATICNPGGTAVTLNASGAVTYSWNPTAGLTPTSGSPVSALPASTTVYTVTGTDANGCAGTATATVSVNENFTPTATATPASVCSGANSQLLAIAATPSGYSVAANILSPVNTGSLTAGTYTTVPSGDDVISNSVNIGFNFNFYGATYSTFVVSTNGDIQFGNPPVSVAWTPQAIPNSTTPTAGASGNTGINNYIALAWKDWTTVGAGEINYYTSGTAPNRICIIDFNDVGNYAGQIILHESTNVIDIITSNIPSNTSVQGIENAGGTAGLAATGRNNVSWTSTSTSSFTFTPVSFTYLWSPTTFLPAGSESTANPVATGVTSTTTYTVTATSSTGCSGTATATVTVSPLTATNITLNGSRCANTNFTATANTTGGSTPYHYAWSDGVGGVYPDAQTVTINKPAGSFTLSVTVTDACGGNISMNIPVTINASPAVAVTPTTGSICIPGGSAVTLNGSGASTYTWLPATGLTPTTGATVSANPTSTTTYTVTGTDANGCTATAISTITVSPAITGAAASATPNPACENSTVNFHASANPIGYSMNSNSGVAFIDISGTGVSVGTLSDDNANNITIPSFTLNGVTYTTAVVGTNGAVVLGSASGAVSAGNAALPSTANSAGNVFLAPWWDDLDVQTNPTIVTQTVGNVFIIQYTNITHNDFTTGGVTFEIQLNQATGTVTYVYQDVIFGNPTQDAAATATVGLQLSSTNAVQYSLNTASLVNGQSITFSPVSLNYSWTGPNGFTSTLQNPGITALTPAATGTYTVTISAPGFCSASATTSLTVSTAPNPPGGNNSIQCGTAVPAAFVTGSGGTFRWYDAQTGGNLLQTGGGSYASSISATTHFWVSESTGPCESARTEVIAFVNSPDAVQASVNNNNPCNNTSIQLTATTTGNTNGNVYNFVWTASPAAGSGIPSSQAGGTGTFGTPASTTVTPTASGTYTYTVTGTDGTLGCVAVSTVVVTVKALPILNGPTASPSTVCAGISSTLTATTSTIGAGMVTLGTGTASSTAATTTSTLGPNPFESYYGGSKQQMIIRASELTAIGLNAGPISAIAFNLSAVESRTLQNYQVKMQHTALTAFASTSFVSGGFTVVRNAAGYTPVSGWNTITFNTNFNWDGTSNILIEINFSNNDGGGSGTNTAVYSTTAFASTLFYRVDNNAAATVDATATASFAAYTQRNNMQINGQILTSGAGSLNYAWNPGSLSGSTVTVTPSASTTYTVTATDPATTCSSKATVTVTVNPLPPAPSGSNGTDQCGTALTDASVSSNNTTDPQVPAFFKWYSAPSGGTLLQSGTSTTYLTPISVTTTFYVSEVSASGCEGPRGSMTTIVSDPDPVTVTTNAGPAGNCIGSSFNLSTSYTPDFNSYATFNLTATGGAASGVTGTVSLTPNSTGTDPYTITPTAAGTYTYTVTALDPDKGCIAVGTVVVTVNSYPTIGSVTATPSTTCSGGASVLTAASFGTTTNTNFAQPFESFPVANFTTTGSGVTWTGSSTYFIQGAGSVQNTYSASANGSLAMNTDISLVGLGNPKLTFSHVCASETGFDFGRIEYSIDGGTNWLAFPATDYLGTGTIPDDLSPNIGFDAGSYSDWSSQFTGSSSTYPAAPATSLWKTETISLSAYNSATTFRVRFRLTSDGSVSYAGWKIDDVKITSFTDISNTLTYNWNPGNLTGGTITVHPAATTIYTVTATNAAGCASAPQTVTVTVTPVTASATATPNTPVCAGTTVTLNGVAGGGAPFTYSWSDGTATVYPATASITVTPTVTTVYTLTVTDACNASATTTVGVNVNPLPVVTVTPNTASFCSPLGTAIALSAGGASTYTWSPSAGLSATTGSSVNATPTSTTIYTVTGTDDNGCVNTATASITVNANPTATASASPNPVCDGSTVTLSSTGTVAANYTVVAIPVSIETASGSSTVLATGGIATPSATGVSLDDGYWDGITLPFSINYFGNTYSTVRIGTNGTLQFGAVVNTGRNPGASSYTSQTIPSGGAIGSGNYLDNFVGGPWIDQDLSSTPFGTVRYFVNGVAPNRKFVVSYESVHVFNSTDNNTSQIILNENGTIDVLLLGGGLTSTATKAIGMENIDGTFGTAAPGRNSGTWTTAANEAWRFTAPAQPAFSYLWSGPAGFSSTNQNPTIPNFSTPNAGVYSVVVTNTLSGCSSAAANTANVAVTPRPTGVLSGASAICAGSSTTSTFSIAVTGTGPWTGTLSPGAIPFSGATSPISVTVPAVSSPATYTIATLNGSLCSATAADLSGSATISINPRPTAVISGGATYCAGQGSTTTTLSIAVTGAGPWSGTLSPGAIPFSGSSSPITVSVTPSSTTTYTIATLNGSQCSSIAADLTGSATVTINPVPATPTITPAGPVTQCGGTVTLTASSPGQWQWNLNGSPIGGATNQTLVVSASGNYSVTVTNESNCSVTSAATSVTINPVPATPTISAGGPTTFCAGGSVTLTSSSATNNQWNLDGSPIGGATNSTLVVTASGDYTVTVTNGFGCSATSAITTVTVNPLAANPTATVVQPTCALGTGTINVTAPLGSGNTYSLDGINFQSNPSFPGQAPGTYTVYVHNAAGCFSPATTNVTVNPQPFVPGAPVITGIVNVCPYIGVPGAAGQITYHATATGNGTQTFNWVIPPTNVTIISGQGTADLTVSFQNGFASQPNKQLRLTVTNQCGPSPMTIYYLAAQVPNTPGPITGPTDACPLITGTPTATYTINKAPGAASYIWTMPTGTSAVHPNGPGINDTIIVVTFNNNFATSAITVAAVNDCNTSGLRSITVTRTGPSQPNVISGPTNACPYITPNAAATYSVPAVPGVTYAWIASNGATVTTGQGSNSVTVSYPIGYTSGTISVTASTGCGTSIARTLTITTLNPATPGVPDVIQTHFCGEPGGRKYTYTLSAMPSNATTVIWTVPAGATFINLSPVSIEVTYPNAAVNGVVTVQATNPCANSVIRSVNVKLPACPVGFAGNNNGTNGTAESKGGVKAAKATPAPIPVAETMEVKIFPNPTVSDFKLEILTSGTEEITVRVLDNQGRLYKNFKVMPYQTIALGAELKAGSYLVEVRQGKTVKTTKVIKF